LEAIKSRWLGWGYDVVSVRVVADGRLSSMIRRNRDQGARESPPRAS
jgi:hypothetical protein